METGGFRVSRRRITRIMKKYNLVSNYTKLQFKKTKQKVNEATDKKILNREFTREIPLEVIITDLTYEVGLAIRCNPRFVPSDNIAKYKVFTSSLG